MKATVRNILAISFVLAACAKNEGNMVRDMGVIQGKTTYVSNTANECILKIKYAVNTNAYAGDLLPVHLFTIDPNGLIRGESGSSFITCETVETKKISTPLFPVSVFLLMDKSVTSITPSYNLDKLTSFKEAFFRSMNEKTGQLEINFGMCAQDNPKVPQMKIVYKDFQKETRQLASEIIAPIFDFGLNAGKSNLPESMDSALSYIKNHSHYANRVLFIYTDDQSGVTDTAFATQIVNKAKNTNTRIVVFSTRAPDNVLYSQRRYVNGSDGFQFNDLGGELTWSASYRNMNTLFDIFENGTMYESTIRLVASDNFFSTNKYGLIKLYIRLFNDSINAMTPLYER